MNHVVREEPMVKAVPVCGGYQGTFRTLRNSRWQAVCENGVAQVYGTEGQALLEAYRARDRSEYGPGILSTGFKAAAVRSEAEALFGKVFPGRGRKPVEVVRK